MPSIVSASLVKDSNSIANGLLAQLAVDVIRNHMATALPDVFVHTADANASGKTLSIIKQHAIAKDLPYTCIPCDGNADEAVALLKTLDKCRHQAAAPACVVHISVSHTLDVQALSRLLFNYVIVGVVIDATGDAIARHPGDIVDIELPSEGPLLQTNEVRLLAGFQHVRPPETIDVFQQISFAGLPADGPDCVLYRVQAFKHEPTEVAMKMLMAFWNTKQTSQDTIPTGRKCWALSFCRRKPCFCYCAKLSRRKSPWPMKQTTPPSRPPCQPPQYFAH